MLNVHILSDRQFMYRHLAVIKLFMINNYCCLQFVFPCIGLGGSVAYSPVISKYPYAFYSAITNVSLLSEFHNNNLFLWNPNLKAVFNSRDI